MTPHGMTLPSAPNVSPSGEFTLADLDVLAAIFADPEVLWWEPAAVHA